MTTMQTNRVAPLKFFFIAFASVSALLVIAGFSRTFFVPLARGTFSKPWFVFVHGLLFLSWISLLLIQAILAVRRRFTWHRRLGWVGASMIPLMTTSGAIVAYWATRRNVAAGQGADALSFFFGTLMDVFLFASLATAAVLTRRSPSIHKRLILIATLAVLGPAVGRISVIGSSADYITVILLFCIVIYDALTVRYVSRATVLGGTWLLVGLFTQTLIGNTTAWLSLAQRIIGNGY
jgi:hypothetical protein